MSAGALRIPRRSFLRACGLTAGGVALGYYFPVGRAATHERAGQASGAQARHRVAGHGSPGRRGSTPMSSSMSVRTAP